MLGEEEKKKRELLIQPPPPPPPPSSSPSHESSLSSRLAEGASEAELAAIGRERGAGGAYT